MKNILVTGGKGQLASCIKDAANNINGLSFLYVDIDELDITKPSEINTFFKEKNIEYCVNCAAYTAVDEAEANEKLAEQINIEGAKNLARACRENDAVLIHISTDFVFDGKQTEPYTENHRENPLGIYGLTKLNGEKAVSETLEQHIILRTSWLYSEYGNNFLKTMLRLANERDELGVVCDQIGTPTYAGDLAEVLVNIILKDKSQYGKYHYSNEGVGSWYDFAKAIFDESGAEVAVMPIKSDAYPTPAVRPKFSVMDKSKIKKEFELEIPYWRDSLKKCLTRLKK